MNSQFVQASPAMPVKKPWNQLSSETPKLRNPRVGLPSLSQASGPKRSTAPVSAFLPVA